MTIQDIFKKAPDLLELDKRMKADQKAWDKGLWILAEHKIVEGIQAGNFFNYDEACIIADYFHVPKNDWSVYGCPLFG